MRTKSCATEYVYSFLIADDDHDNKDDTPYFLSFTWYHTE